MHSSHVSAWDDCSSLARIAEAGSPQVKNKANEGGGSHFCLIMTLDGVDGGS